MVSYGSSDFSYTYFPFIVLAFRDLASLRTHFWPFTEVVRKVRLEVTWKTWEPLQTRKTRPATTLFRSYEGKTTFVLFVAFCWKDVERAMFSAASRTVHLSRCL